MKYVVRISFVLVLLFAVQARAWTRFDDVTLVPNSRNDGDSFFVEAEGRLMHVRLYYVDCPETWDGTYYQQRRLREQAQFFGLDSVEETKRFGEVAAVRVREQLQEPFTIYTVFHATPGVREIPRYYAIVELSDGRDLAEWLAGQGLARVLGVRREMPDGRSVAEMDAGLEDLQLTAIMKREGIWAATDPDLLPSLRAARRAEREEDRVARRTEREILQGGLDLNHADAKELAALPGVGEVLAQRIIQHRPFQNPKEILRVPGIGPGTFDRISSHIHVHDES